MIEGAFSVEELQAAVDKVAPAGAPDRADGRDDLLEMLATETDRRAPTIIEGVDGSAASPATPDPDAVEAVRVEAHGLKGAALVVGQTRASPSWARSSRSPSSSAQGPGTIDAELAAKPDVGRRGAPRGRPRRRRRRARAALGRRGDRRARRLTDAPGRASPPDGSPLQGILHSCYGSAPANAESSSNSRRGAGEPSSWGEPTESGSAGSFSASPSANPVGRRRRHVLRSIRGSEERVGSGLLAAAMLSGARPRRPRRGGAVAPGTTPDAAPDDRHPGLATLNADGSATAPPDAPGRSSGRSQPPTRSAPSRTSTAAATHPSSRRATTAPAPSASSCAAPA